jgi:hypothetical protein
MIRGIASQIAAVLVGLSLAAGVATYVAASQPPGQQGYEGQPGNQGGGSGQPANGLAGYEGQPGNQGGH